MSASGRIEKKKTATQRNRGFLGHEQKGYSSFEGAWKGTSEETQRKVNGVSRSRIYLREWSKMGRIFILP